MKDLQDLWSEIQEKTLEEDEISAIVNRKSVSELVRFKRLLYVELYSSWALLAILFFFHKAVGNEITLLIFITVLLGTLLNIITLRKLQQLQLLEDVKSFLKKTIKVLWTFVIGFIVSIQMVGVIVIITVKILRQNLMSWSEWFSSAEGTSVLIVLFVIEVVLLSYAWIFYVRRIHSLKKLLEEMNH
ncbi:putative membrane protein [Catalinimonas alkaloidigena]|uniref:hypothetical protein n=1 Tax=Catalinimonas alkaloidigena TaxID=1075417 RepID=UPI002404FFDB|nr:hypothetical protein [Catalinimonas alkaloidigena]MDF9801333.1 putative membrane protein [Catalinimonas alkaloidigena]